MIVVTHIRKKCIGCNYCADQDPQRWRMSKKDGKSVLVGAEEKKGFWTARIPDSELEACKRAAAGCPVHIIKVG